MNIFIDHTTVNVVLNVYCYNFSDFLISNIIDISSSNTDIAVNNKDKESYILRLYWYFEAQYKPPDAKINNQFSNSCIPITDSFLEFNSQNVKTQNIQNIRLNEITKGPPNFLFTHSYFSTYDSSHVGFFFFRVGFIF